MSDTLKRLLDAGVSEGTAKKIFGLFGEQTRAVIEAAPSFLAQVNGITPELIWRIRRAFSS